MGHQHRKRGLLLLIAHALISACSGLSIVEEPSDNFNSRINHLVIHFTSENFERSLAILTGKTERKVSSHYLVPDQSDATYPHDSLAVYSLVSPADRAWHAGESFWARKTGLNDQSIGVEIVNRSGCLEDIRSLGNSPQFHISCEFHGYSTAQIALLVKLLRQILDEYPDIRPEAIVGHADIAPDRKVDPGPLFPWEQLYEAGVGAWFDKVRVAEIIKVLEVQPLTVHQQQSLLAAYGYSLKMSGREDLQSQLAVRAFQMHFRPSNYSGFFDRESTARLLSLLERYRPQTLKAIEDLPEQLR